MSRFRFRKSKNDRDFQIEGQDGVTLVQLHVVECLKINIRK